MPKFKCEGTPQNLHDQIDSKWGKMKRAKDTELDRFSAQPEDSWVLVCKECDKPLTISDIQCNQHQEVNIVCSNCHIWTTVHCRKCSEPLREYEIDEGHISCYECRGESRYK